MMGYILSALSCFNVVYYAVLVFFTDYGWRSQIYWPISAVIFAIAGVILIRDRRHWEKTGEGLPLMVTVPINVTFGAYILLVAAFTLADLLMGLETVADGQDYLILVETMGQVDTLAQSDYDMLDTALEYVRNQDNDKCKMVLAGYNMEDADASYTKEIQNLMEAYLENEGFSDDRMIIHTAATSLRKNILYNYAYVLVDWYEQDHTREEDPEVTILANQLSALRYKLMIYNLGLKVHVMTYSENVICWPARIMEEIRDTIYCHLMNQYKYQ